MDPNKRARHEHMKSVRSKAYKAAKRKTPKTVAAFEKRAKAERHIPQGM